jgi:hypothetical protein
MDGAWIATQEVGITGVRGQDALPPLLSGGSRRYGRQGAGYGQKISLMATWTWRGAYAFVAVMKFVGF